VYYLTLKGNNVSFFVSLSPFSQGNEALTYQFGVCVCVCVWNVLPDGLVPALVSNVIFLKYFPVHYPTVAHSLSMHSVFFLAL